jgi:hypothetical protein
MSISRVKEVVIVFRLIGEIFAVPTKLVGMHLAALISFIMISCVGVAVHFAKPGP